jgi:putative hydrolase of HD superfamily
MAECFVGDITPDDPVSPAEKHKKEMEAMKVLVTKLPPSLAKEFYTALQVTERDLLN